MYVLPKLPSIGFLTALLFLLLLVVGQDGSDWKMSEPSNETRSAAAAVHCARKSTDDPRSESSEAMYTHMC